ncbi:MAG: alpha/beta hydrolase [Chitinophagaceae bacterium]|nr:alpha/beta hydrolase [Polaromonas sp.]
MKLMPIILISLGVLLAAALWWLWTPDKDRTALERQYLNAPTDMIDVAGTRLHVRDSGPKTAPAVIFLHGFGASLHTWEPWANALSNDLRVIRIDLPGSGLSLPDPTGDYSDKRSLQILIALMDKLGLARASLVGNSIGGRIAWTFAGTHPARVDKLVLVSPDGFASPGFEYGKKPEVPMMVKLMSVALPKPLLTMSLKPAYANPATMTDALATRYHDMMLAPGSRDALLARMAQTVLSDPKPILKKITAPTLLVWGEQDAMIPFANSNDYLMAIAGSKRVSFKGAGHLPHEEVPEESVVSVREFLMVPTPVRP